jgi:hypothetical protein
VLAELENQVAGEILDRGDRRERLTEALGLEPIEAGLLQFGISSTCGIFANV